MLNKTPTYLLSLQLLFMLLAEGLGRISSLRLKYWVVVFEIKLGAGDHNVRIDSLRTEL
jgi:hypothetical protein